MKKLFLAIIGLTLFTQCDRNNDFTGNLQNTSKITLPTITQEEKDDLAYMYEEEKMARDTYNYLYQKWNLNEFGNIRLSEQSHMNAVENLLIKYNIPYQKLEEGKFVNQTLQALYNQLITQGSISSTESLKVGATIEDVDIKDLKTLSTETQNTLILKIYGNLSCGSKNHLRVFASALNNIGSSYTPQYITPSEYDIIINSPIEPCGN